MEKFKEQNTGVKQWAGSSLKEIKNSYSSMVGTQSGVGSKSLRMRTGQSFGEINRISFGLSRYLVFVHKGAGSGMGGNKGSSWLNSIGVKISTKSASLGKMNTGNRKAKEFFNPVIDAQVPKLADIVAGFKGDLAVKTIKIK